MKKKILLLLLCMLMIVPLFVVGASAEDTQDSIGPWDVWCEEVLPDHNTDLMSQYGDFRVSWDVNGSSLVDETRISAFSGASSSNFNSIVFIGKKTYNGVHLPTGDYPMILSVNDQHSDSPTFSYVYRSDYFRFKWYMTDSGLCTVAVYDSAMADDPIMVVNIGLDVTLYKDGIIFSCSYDRQMQFEFYFEFAYLDRMNVQYNSYYRGGFECFLNCLGACSVNGKMADNISMPDIYKEQYGAGYDDGYEFGLTIAQEKAYEEGYEYGYFLGRTDVIDTVDGVSFFLAALFEAPYRFLATFLDIELFGINVFGIVSSIVGIALIAICLFFVVKVVGHFK